MGIDVLKSLAILFGCIFTVLVFFTVVLYFLKRSNCVHEKGVNVAFLGDRIRAWWFFAIFLCLAVLCGRLGVLIFFAVVSFQCLREYLSMIKTRIGDHHALVWSFYFFLPLNYVLLGFFWGIWFVIFIPVGAFVFLPITAVLRKDTKQFLNRTAQIHWGLMICVYFLSYVPALLLNASYSAPTDDYYIDNSHVVLIVFFLLVVQAANVFEYIWNTWLPGRRIFSRQLSESKSIEGLVAGFIGACVLAFLFYGFTPFSLGEMLFVVPVTVLAGLIGRVILDAVKQDKGMENWSYQQGSASRSGMLDLVDSFCFAAPVFFYMHYFWQSI